MVLWKWIKLLVLRLLSVIVAAVLFIWGASAWQLNQAFEPEIRPALTLPDDPEQAIELAAMLLAHTVISDLVDDGPGLVAEYELVLEIGRNPDLEPTYRRWQDRLEAMLHDYASQLGSCDAEGDARLVLATLRGLEIEALARPSSPAAVDDLRAVFHRLLSALYAAR